MVATESTMVPIGTPAPPFALPDASGAVHELAGHAGSPVVVAFVCNHCPYVKHIADALPVIAGELSAAGVYFVAVNSNDAEAHPDDAPAAMSAFAADHAWTFPYLVDDSQEVAKAYRAACTPDFFLLDARHRVAYRGRMDGARPGNGVPADGGDLLAAARHVTAGEAVPEPHEASMGCNIKWKPGNEPDYFG